MIQVIFRNLHSFITGYHMELMNSKSQASMKARIYVKLHGKKLLELSQLGLYHLISACLIVVLTSEASDMVIFLITHVCYFYIFGSDQQDVCFDSATKFWKCPPTSVPSRAD